MFIRHSNFRQLLLDWSNAPTFASPLLAGYVVLFLISDSYPLAWRYLIDVLAVIQIGVLWYVFKEFWSRLAIATCVLLLVEVLFSKWFFPHYVAPAACLIWYLPVEGLRRIWHWNSQPTRAERPLTRTEKRRLGRETEAKRKPALNFRILVYLLPAACAISLVWRVEARLNGWKTDPYDPDRQALLMDDWSLRRADLDHWMAQQPAPQLVFVRYSAHHNVNFEWVYNHPDITHSHVIWARDLGAEHNRLLLNLLPDRTVWLVEADRRAPQLIPYAEASAQPPQPPSRKLDEPLEEQAIEKGDSCESLQEFAEPTQIRTNQLAGLS